MSIPNLYFEGQPKQREALKGENLRHIRALRLKKGDSLTLFNGKGLQFLGTIKELTRNEALVEINETKTIPRKQARITISSCLPKGKRAVFLVEKLAELGVERFIPLITQRSIVRPRQSGIEKLKKTAIEAASQSNQAWTMEISEPMQLDEVIKLDKHYLKVIATPKGACLDEVFRQKQDKIQGKKHEQKQKSILFIVGPEGGFTENEIKLATEQGFSQATLGSALLRIETAAIMLAASAKYAFG